MQINYIKNEQSNFDIQNLYNANTVQFWATKVEFTQWNGVQAHVGYYSNGAIIVTLPNGIQQLIANGAVVAGLSDEKDLTC